MKKLAFTAVSFLSAALLPLAAHADGLLGSTVDVLYHYNDPSGPLVIETLDHVLVTAGTELSCPGSAQLCGALSAPSQTVDIGDSSIRYDYVGQNGNTGGFFNVAVNTFAFESLFRNAVRFVVSPTR